MPTSTGLPQVNEDILWTEKDGSTTRGRVLVRSTGQTWAIRVIWLDGPIQGQYKWITEAAFWQNKIPGFRVVPKQATPTPPYTKAKTGPSGELANYLWLLEGPSYNYIVKAYTKNRALDLAFGSSRASKQRPELLAGLTVTQIGVVIPHGDWTERVLVNGLRPDVEVAQ